MRQWRTLCRRVAGARRHRPGERFIIDSPATAHAVERLDGDRYAVAMGVPQFEPTQIPLAGFAHARDEYALPVHGETVRFGAVSMGNPHAVVEVGRVDAAPVERVGALLQQNAAFPDSVNVGFAQVVDPCMCACACSSAALAKRWPAEVAPVRLRRC